MSQVDFWSGILEIEQNLHVEWKDDGNIASAFADFNVFHEAILNVDINEQRCEKTLLVALFADSTTEKWKRYLMAIRREEGLLDWVERYRYQALTELLKHGSEPNVCDKKGLSPLRKAVEYGEIDSALLLLHYGARPKGSLQEKRIIDKLKQTSQELAAICHQMHRQDFIEEVMLHKNKFDKAITLIEQLSLDRLVGKNNNIDYTII